MHLLGLAWTRLSGSERTIRAQNSTITVLFRRIHVITACISSLLAVHQYLDWQILVNWNSIPIYIAELHTFSLYSEDQENLRDTITFTLFLVSKIKIFRTVPWRFIQARRLNYTMVSHGGEWSPSGRLTSVISTLETRPNMMAGRKTPAHTHTRTPALSPVISHFTKLSRLNIGR
jgi:hypothetical protein